MCSLTTRRDHGEFQIALSVVITSCPCTEKVHVYVCVSSSSGVDWCLLNQSHDLVQHHLIVALHPT